MNKKLYVAEFLGTFMLTLMVSLGVISGLGIIVPMVAGITLGLFVYMVGPISGAHLNPAVTTALWSAKKIKGKVALGYMVVQVLAGFLAMVLAQHITSGQFVLGAVTVEPGNSAPIIFSEIMGAFVLMLGVSSVVFKKVEDSASGLVIGGCLMLGAMLAGTGSAGILNPAVAVGLGAISWSYLLSPLVGAFLGVRLYQYMAGKH